MTSSMERALVGAQVIETAENYVRADDPLTSKPEGPPVNEYARLDSDEAFWQNVLNNPERLWGRLVRFDYAIFSEWIARVPGLYWMPQSAQLRQLAEQELVERSERWTVYQPLGKSRKVMGGVGTLRLPPGTDGYRLACLTTNLNASVGVPALVAPEVWQHHRLEEGRILSGEARWQPMDQGWASRLPTTRDIPRGYLVLNQPDDLQVRAEERAPTLIHPFTVMEYYAGSTELFDFVFAGADTARPSFRSDLERFFEMYKDQQERYGSYLLAGDMIQPLWEATFYSPEDLRRADPSAESQLDLLLARVRERHLGGTTLDRLLEVLSEAATSTADLRRISEEIGIPANIWLRGGSVAEASSQLLSEALRRHKIEELVELLAMSYPTLMRPSPSEPQTPASEPSDTSAIRIAADNSPANFGMLNVAAPQQQTIQQMPDSLEDQDKAP